MSSVISELSVLVTDDSLTQRQYAKALCQDLGVNFLFEAANGMDALDVLASNKIDVVLIDLEMPIMDGVELIRSIAQKKLKTSVIILSAKDPILIASVGTMAEADGLHVVGTFQKPLLPDALECSFLRFIQDTKAAAEPKKSADIEVTALELSQALANNELTLAFQPKLTVQGLLLRGVEALARWRHPTKGLIPPGLFIELAERHGMIDALTHYLLEEAFKYKRTWQQYGLRFHLAFNLSPLSLADSDMVDWLCKLTEQYGIAPAEITFEVTENALLGELASAIRTLARLRLKGFHIAIDDYGTGFANAQQLSRVPATELKIDRSLVHRASTRPQQRTILASTVDLAKNLNLTTVAEGVETEEDFKILCELGVDLVQGYYFSKPLFADDLLIWVKTGLSQMRRQHEKK
jgi:EAL domain-containing protein (putative c-di-GMP-specific phosphodiesterase class I)/AmiR/NasT family two-component response regulator